MSILAVKNLNVSYGDLTIVDDVSFTLEENHWLMLVGPNGAGKSTVVNAISQGVPYTGDVIYDGRDVCRYKPSELAKRVGVLAQSHSVTYSFTVGEVVRLGRYSHSAGILRSPSDDDDERIHAALEVTGMLELENQSVLTLSGGELQRVFLAQIFAQDPKVLVLDEPTNHLDLVYQK
ncbi:MAG: ABC transporter ATP-binding protein, partial [Coriobacteriales bacterium]|nr:ABC transporter ATP-binding protein [Coriobacteriales bacterium]